MTYAADLSVDQANQLDLILSNEINNSGEFGGGARKQNLITESSDKPLVALNDFMDADFGEDIDLRESLKVKFSLLDKLHNDNISSIVGQDDPFLDKN